MPFEAGHAQRLMLYDHKRTVMTKQQCNATMRQLKCLSHNSRLPCDSLTQTCLAGNKLRPLGWSQGQKLNAGINTLPQELASKTVALSPGQQLFSAAML